MLLLIITILAALTIPSLIISIIYATDFTDAIDATENTKYFDRAMSLFLWMIMSMVVFFLLLSRLIEIQMVN